MLDPAFSSRVLYCLEINFSLSVTLAVSVGMLLGRAWHQFPTLEAATRAPAAASSWLGPWLELLHGMACPADVSENRAGVWENSVRVKPVWEMRSNLMLAISLPVIETNEEPAESSMNWN